MLFRGSDQPTPDAPGLDAVTDEIKRWHHIATVELFRSADGLLNEFKMMWELRARFPMHFLVFKQMACHLPHEANVERRFSILPVSKTQAPTPVLESSSSSTHACHTLTYWVCQHGNRS